MIAIKQPGKGDNAHQRPLNITKLSKNNNSKNGIKSIFNVDMQHGLIKV
jgi:hypothetical protein